TVLLYNGGCKADVGTACTNDPVSNCTTEEICSDGSCACDTTTHYESGSTCVTRLNPGMTCTSLPTNACKDNSVCTTNNECTCNEGYYDSDGSTATSGICTAKIALSQTCSNSLVGVVQCVTSGADCATDNKCRCNTGTFDGNGFGTADGVCVDINNLVVSSVGYSNLGTNSVTISWAAPSTYSSQVTRYEVTWTSTAGNGNKIGDTSTSLEVTGLQSASQYSFYVRTIESGSQTTEQLVTTTTPLMVTTKSLLGNTCGDCADPNAICSTKCVCDSGYYDSDGDTTNVGGTCTQKIALSQTCSNSLVGVVQCVTSGADCATDNKCRCNTGTFDSNGFGTADGECVNINNLVVSSVGYSNLGTNSVTISWAAPSTYSSQVTRYEVTWTSTAGNSNKIGDTSTSLEVTGLQSASQYSFYVRTIESGSQTTEQLVTTTTPLMVTTKSLLGNTCGDCADPNAICSTKCVCDSGYYDSDGDTTNVGGTCTQKIALSASCNSLLTGVSQCSDGNAECTGAGETHVVTV
ncbi:uncharacterized protein LOC117318887, partial [Pecten maximus]|uniref:uncharacterized protein LOC117318887 n=1 Tax=Pecten maximus TaxID=6579 RepID=UPI001458F9B6